MGANYCWDSSHSPLQQKNVHFLCPGETHLQLYFLYVKHTYFEGKASHEAAAGEKVTKSVKQLPRREIKDPGRQDHCQSIAEWALLEEKEFCYAILILLSWTLGVVYKINQTLKTSRENNPTKKFPSSIKQASKTRLDKINQVSNSLFQLRKHNSNHSTSCMCAVFHTLQV